MKIEEYQKTVEEVYVEVLRAKKLFPVDFVNGLADSK